MPVSPKNTLSGNISERVFFYFHFKIYTPAKRLKGKRDTFYIQFIF